MPEQEQARKQLRAARDELHAGQDALALRRQATLKLEAALAEARRTRSDDVRRISANLEEAGGAEQRLRERVAKLAPGRADAAGNFRDAFDPTESISGCGSERPVL